VHVNIQVTSKGVEAGKPLDKTELWVFDGQTYGPGPNR
jgi:hypothetical protein